MEINQPAPDFSLPDLQGRIHHLSDGRGRIVVINFWSAECPWVERVDRELRQALRAWGSAVVLLTVAANAHESDPVLAEAVRGRGLPFVLRGSPEVLNAYAVEVTPCLFVIDRDGVVRYAGAFDDVTFRKRLPERQYLTEAVTSLLADRLPDPARTQPYGCVVVRRMLESC